MKDHEDHLFTLEELDHFGARSEPMTEAEKDHVALLNSPAWYVVRKIRKHNKRKAEEHDALMRIAEALSPKEQKDQP